MNPLGNALVNAIFHPLTALHPVTSGLESAATLIYITVYIYSNINIKIALIHGLCRAALYK